MGLVAAKRSRHATKAGNGGAAPKAPKPPKLRRSEDVALAGKMDSLLDYKGARLAWAAPRWAALRWVALRWACG